MTKEKELLERVRQGDPIACNMLDEYYLTRAYIEPFEPSLENSVTLKKLNERIHRLNHDEDILWEMGHHWSSIPELMNEAIDECKQIIAKQRSDDFRNAFRYFEISANLGDPEGMWNVGWRLWQSEGAIEDKELAKLWWQRSASRGHQAARIRLMELGEEVPNTQVSIDSPDVKYKSVFISFGSPDSRIALRIYEELIAHGIDSFLFTKNARPGDKLHRMMRIGINTYSHVLLLCSCNSLNRSGVLNEIEETLARESREGGSSVLIPITLDDYVFHGWNPKRSDIAQTVRDRVILDLRNAHSDPSVLKRGVKQLLVALS